MRTGLPGLLGLLLMLAGCRVDMHVDPKFEPLEQSDFFANGMASRPFVEGTVARGQLRADTYFYTGMSGGQPGNEMPFPVTESVLQRGQERYNIYCAPCHSVLGDGNGVIVQRGYSRPPSLHTGRVRESSLGHYFDVMTNGFGAMPDYASQVPPADRWAIAAYMRALQLSQSATQENVPAGQQVPSAPAAPPQEGE